MPLKQIKDFWNYMGQQVIVEVKEKKLLKIG